MAYMSKECPCHIEGGDCTRRTLYCHSGCQDYKLWKGIIESAKALEKQEKDKRSLDVESHLRHKQARRKDKSVRGFGTA